MPLENYVEIKVSAHDEYDDCAKIRCLICDKKAIVTGQVDHEQASLAFLNHYLFDHLVPDLQTIFLRQGIALPPSLQKRS
jgi:hypothetical protein